MISPKEVVEQIMSLKPEEYLVLFTGDEIDTFFMNSNGRFVLSAGSLSMTFTEIVPSDGYFYNVMKEGERVATLILSSNRYRIKRGLKDPHSGDSEVSE